MKARMVALVIAAGVAGHPAGLAASEPSAESGDLVARELAAVNRTLSDLALLAREHLEARETENLLRRIELQERRLAPLSDELRRVERERLEKENEIERMREYSEQTEESLDAARLQDPEADEIASLEEEMKQMELYLRSLGGEKDRLDTRILDLEDRLAEGRDEIALLDEKLEERLEASRKPGR